jgi:hypothetical protein
VPACDEIHGDHVRDQRDVRMLESGRLERLLHSRPRRVGDMDDPAETVPPFTRQVQCAAFIGERDAQFDKPLDGLGCGLDDMLNHLPVVQSGAGDHRVVDVRFEAVAFLEHRGDPALRPAGGALSQRALGDHRDLAVLGEVQRSRQSGRAGADDQHVRGGAHAA